MTTPSGSSNHCELLCEEHPNKLENTPFSCVGSLSERDPTHPNSWQAQQDFFPTRLRGRMEGDTSTTWKKVAGMVETKIRGGHHTVQNLLMTRFKSLYYADRNKHYLFRLDYHPPTVFFGTPTVRALDSDKPETRSFDYLCHRRNFRYNCVNTGGLEALLQGNLPNYCYSQ